MPTIARAPISAKTDNDPPTICSKGQPLNCVKAKSKGTSNCPAIIGSTGRSKLVLELKGFNLRKLKQKAPINKIRKPAALLRNLSLYMYCGQIPFVIAVS